MSIRKQSIHGVIIKALSIVFGFVVVALLARLLSPTEYGVYSVVLATVTVLTVPTALGLPNYVVREVSKAMSDGDGFKTRRIVQAAGTLVLIVSTLMLVAVALWTTLTGDSTDSYSATIWVGLWLIPVMALTQVMGATLRGIGYVQRGMLLGLILRHILFSTLLIVWVVAFGELTTKIAMTLHVVAAFLALSYGVVNWLLFRPSVGDGPAASGVISMRDMLLSTGVMGIIAGAQTLNANMSVIMLGALRDAEAAGLYKLASTAALLTVAGLQAINMVMMPHFARIKKEGTPEQLQNLATRSARMILLTALPAAVLLIVLGRQIIQVAFGAEYLASYTPMVILVVGQLVSAIFGSVVTILNMTGFEKDAMKGILIGSAINLALNLILIPQFGANGAAFATATTVVFWNILLHSMIRRRLGITSTAFSFKKRH